MQCSSPCFSNEIWAVVTRIPPTSSFAFCPSPPSFSAASLTTNSLGLLGDAFHMLFDCVALVVGLYASVLAKWKPSRVFSYGYSRVEVLSGYANAVFLLLITIGVLIEAVERIFFPEEIKTEKLLLVSGMGFCVNLVGMFAFSHAHAASHGHGGKPCTHAHGTPAAAPAAGSSGAPACTSHGHSHAHGSHGHSHAHASPGGPTTPPQLRKSVQPPAPQKRNANMEGVFLHVLADTLGSVGVIISSILIEQFGLVIADPICSIFISALIVAHAYPLLKRVGFCGTRNSALQMLVVFPLSILEELLLISPLFLCSPVCRNSASEDPRRARADSPRSPQGSHARTFGFLILCCSSLFPFYFPYHSLFFHVIRSRHLTVWLAAVCRTFGTRHKRYVVSVSPGSFHLRTKCPIPDRLLSFSLSISELELQDIHCSLHVICEKAANPQRILSQVSALLKDLGVSQATVQIAAEDSFSRKGDELMAAVSPYEAGQVINIY